MRGVVPEPATDGVCASWATCYQPPTKVRRSRSYSRYKASCWICRLGKHRWPFSCLPLCFLPMNDERQTPRLAGYSASRYSAKIACSRQLTKQLLERVRRTVETSKSRNTSVTRAAGQRRREAKRKDAYRRALMPLCTSLAAFSTWASGTRHRLR